MGRNEIFLVKPVSFDKSRRALLRPAAFLFFAVYGRFTGRGTAPHHAGSGAPAAAAPPFLCPRRHFPKAGQGCFSGFFCGFFGAAAITTPAPLPRCVPRKGQTDPAAPARGRSGRIRRLRRCGAWVWGTARPARRPPPRPGRPECCAPRR